MEKREPASRIIHLRHVGSFKQCDVVRAIKAATKAGLSNFRVEINPLDGKIVILTNSIHNDEASELDKELEAFEASK